MVLARKMSRAGQFNAQEEREWINHEVYQQMRGFGWSRETVLTRMGIVDGDRELLDIPIHTPEGIFIFGHCVLTRANNICERCRGIISTGEIVLGVVTGGYGTGSADRYYLCSNCLREVEYNAKGEHLDGERLKSLREQVKEYNRKNK